MCLSDVCNLQLLARRQFVQVQRGERGDEEGVDLSQACQTLSQRLPPKALFDDAARVIAFNVSVVPQRHGLLLM